MKVSELIEDLQDCNPDAIVILAGDQEGNYYCEVAGVDYPLYRNGDNEIGLSTLTEELREEGYTEEDLVVGEPCVVLFP